jgi:CRP/FNR family transcriptional regulator
MDSGEIEALRDRLIEAFPVLGELPETFLGEALSHAIYRRVPAGTVMFSANSPCTGFPLVLAGSVRVGQRYPNGRELQLYRVHRGESCLLSSSCLLGDANYSATGVAEEDLEVVTLRAADFNRLLEVPAFRRYVFALFSERLAAVMELVEAITVHRLDKRLAASLLSRAADGPDIQATHQILADELGSVREIVTRLLRSFEDRGWVELARGQITVRDLQALRSLAQTA